MPISIIGSGDIMPKNSLQIIPKDIIMIIDRPVDVSGYNVETRHELITKVRDIIIGNYQKGKALLDKKRSGLISMEQKANKISKAREVYGIIGLVSAFFLFLSLVSYQPSDPSFTHYVTGSLKTKNIFGSVGSYTSDALIKLMGLSALMLPIIFLIIAFKYFLDGAFKTNKILILGITLGSPLFLFRTYIAYIKRYAIIWRQDSNRRPSGATMEDLF